MISTTPRAPHLAGQVHRFGGSLLHTLERVRQLCQHSGALRKAPSPLRRLNGLSGRFRCRVAFHGTKMCSSCDIWSKTHTGWGKVARRTSAILNAAGSMLAPQLHQLASAVRKGRPAQDPEPISHAGVASGVRGTIGVLAAILQ